MEQGAQEGKDRSIDADIAGEFQAERLIAADHSLCVFHKGDRPQYAVRIVGNNTGNFILDGFFHKRFQAGGIKTVGLVDKDAGIFREIMFSADIFG